jgi:hypothetical protein
MPVGFARSLFGGSATSSGADWSAYTGANDVEYTISDCSGIIGFKEFDSTRGLLVTYQAVEGSPGYDLCHVRLVTLDPSANTLTFGSIINHGIGAQSLFQNKQGTIQKTADGAIVVQTGDVNDTSRTYFLSDGVLTQSNKITTARFASFRGAVRRSDGDFFQVSGGITHRQMRMTNTATSSPTSSEIREKYYINNGLYFWDYCVLGYESDNVLLAFESAGAGLVQCKRYDISQSPFIDANSSTISGLGTSTLDLETTDNYVDVKQGMGMNSGCDTTGFNDTAILLERQGSNTSPQNIWQFHIYKANTSVYHKVTVTDTALSKVDPASYAFLGGTNKNCFFMSVSLAATSPSRVSRYHLIDLNLETLSARIVKAETLNFEVNRRADANVFRFGNDRGLYNYQSNKLLLMVP